MKKGTLNAITDIEGVAIGHVTLDGPAGGGDYHCTGVTAILPHSGNLFEEKVPAASFVLNGFGKTAGLIQVAELGVIESPIMLTNTFSVGAVLEGTLQYMLEENPAIGDSASSLNVVVGECNDSYLNSMRNMAVRPEHAIEAIQAAAGGTFAQGATGAGKGMICYGAKGGIGSASRLVEAQGRTFTAGALVLTNFGRGHECLFPGWVVPEEPAPETPVVGDKDDREKRPDGSVIIVVATDAPLDSRQLGRLAKRAAIGLGRTGTHIHNGSGDIIIAFSTGFTVPHGGGEMTVTREVLKDDHPVMNDLFQAVIESTEEAILQSLLHAETTFGRKGRIVKKAVFESVPVK
ncbi:DmpA family aminopeptidase [Bhargavaea cecembensis]|uniref:DmpA family aminopeptidase n=1 Tax=Bhargavaea cecembensis TaxID=394098 RepID=UPI00058E1143|nr:P1 family peptidase [Bhargavaea cecembensis]